MIKRADAGNSGIGILSAMGGYFYKPDITGVRKSLSDFTKGIPEETKYNGVLKTLDENCDKSGVTEMLNDVYDRYPGLKEVA